MSVPADTTQLYVDGVADNSENAGVLNTHAGPIMIGSQMEGDGVTPTPGLRGTMYIGKVRIHDGALTAEQVLNNYNEEAASFPATATVAPVTGPIHRWSFNEPAGAAANGAKVTDSAGNRHGAIRGDGVTWTGTSAALTGGGSGTAPYVDLPNRLFSDRAPELGGSGEVTIEFWATNTAARTWSRYFDFGSSANSEQFAPGGGGEGTDYLTLTAQVENNTGATRLEMRNIDAAGNGAGGAGGPAVGITTDVPTTFGSERHITVIWRDGVSVSVYDGTTAIGEFLTAGVKMINLNDINNWLGRSNWNGDQNFQGEFNEFRIYDRALHLGEIRKNDVDGPDAVMAAPPDADGDTLPDWWEISYAGTDVSATTGGQAGLDGDADGLSNIQEFQRGTRPNLNDTDGDGSLDGAEVTNNTNPLDTDSDDDGLNDGGETTAGTNPLLADTDGDTYTDGQEVAAGSNPLDSNSIPVLFLAARYSFSGPVGTASSGALVADSVSGINAYIRGEGATWTGTGLTLPGGGSGTAPYVDLQNGMLSRFARTRGGRGAVTIEGWATIPTRTDAAWQRLFEFGSSFPGGARGEIFAPGRFIMNDTRGLDYLMVSAARGNDTALRRLDWTNDDATGGTGNTFGVDFGASAGTLDAPFHYALSFDETVGQAKYYENGVLVASASTLMKLDNLNDVNNWLGRSNWTGDGNTSITYDEFRIYAGALSQTDIQKSMAKGPDTLPGGTNGATDITTLKVLNANGWPEWYLDRTPGAPAPVSDADGDTLTALQELGRGSNPAVADTDGDGLRDDAENGSNVFVSAASPGSNPSLADTDSDGLGDSQEAAAGTNPSNPDTDGDSIADSSDPAPLTGAAQNRVMAHRWIFDDLPVGGVADGTPVLDVIGGAATNGFIRGSGASANGTSVLLPGGANNETSPYVDLPNGIISSRNRLTAVTWMTIDAATNWSRVFDFGASNGIEVPAAGGIGNGTEYMFLSAGRGTDINLQRFALKEDLLGESFYDWTLSDRGLTIPGAGTEIFFAVTVDSSTGIASLSSLYRDGVWIMQNAQLTYTLSQINDVNNWLGRSQYAGDPTLTGSFNEFRLYDGILNRNEIRRLYAGGPDGLRILDVQQAGTDLTYTWNSKANLPYTAEASEDLQTWTPLQTGIVATGDTTSFTVPVGTGKRYFRARLEE